MNQTLSPRNAASKSLRAIGILLCVAIAIASYRYIADAGFVPDNIANNLFIHPWLLIHVLASATALLIGPFQFLTARKPAKRGIHRILGRVYAIGCLVGAVSGLVLAVGASTGYVATTGFGALAIVWFATVATGWLKAMQGDIADHQKWMTRSFALTFAAVTLRIYLPISQGLGLDFDDSYRAISFLCWIPNLIVAEFLLSRRRMASASAARPFDPSIPSEL